MKTIEAASNSIMARAKTLGIITTIARKYYTAMGNYILGMNPAEHSRVGKSLEEMETALEVLRGGVNDLKLPTLRRVYSAFATADRCAADFITLCSNTEYARASLMELSSGQHSEMREDINRAIIQHGKYMSAGREDDDIFDLALPPGGQREYLGSLREYNEPNKLTLELIRRLLPVLVGDDHLYVSELLATQKRLITGGLRVNVGNWTEYYLGRVSGEDATFTETNPLEGHERVLFRYNCTPATLSMSPAQLFKTLGWSWNDNLNIDQNLVNAGSSGRNIIVIARTHGTPLEFNFRGVLDKTFASAFPVKPFSGLSKNFLARYTTTNMLTGVNDEVTTKDAKGHVDTGKNPSVDDKDRSRSEDNVNAPIAKRLSPGPPVRMYSAMVDNRYPVGFVVSRLDWEVIETLDMINFRSLGCTLQGVSYADVTNQTTKTVRPEGTFTTLIPGSRLLGLIMGPSTLPTEYNRIHSQRIRDMFDPLAPAHLSRYASYEKVVAASEPIKNKVREHLDKWAQSKLHTVKNNRDWQSLFVGDEFVAAVNAAISAAMIKGSAIEKVRSPEYTITQIARFSLIVGKFIKAIARAGEPITERTFAEYKRDEVDRILAERFSGIIRRAADLLDGDKIWTGHELTLKEFIIAY